MKIFSFLNYLLLTGLITIIMLLIYATVQQTYRTAANDPQIQIVEDIKEKILRGRSIEKIFQSDTIDLAQSLSTFVELYDASGKPIRSSGYLNGRMAQLPAGVLEVTKNNGIHSVTWQPNHDVRLAMVLAYINSSPAQFVAAGRSLRETEEREYTLRKMVFIAWVMCIAIVLLAAAIMNYKKLK